MEDLVGILVFVVFVGVSIVSRLAKNQEQQKGTPPMRGPVPGEQRPRPAAPMPRAPQPQPQRTVTPQRPEPAMAPPLRPPQPEYDPWSTGSMPGLADPEGPEESERVDVEMNRFSREREEMEHREMEEIGRFAREREQFEKSRFAEMKTGLVHREDIPVEATAEETRNLELSTALANPASFAQAVVLAEVLGKPKAKRRGRI